MVTPAGAAARGAPLPATAVPLWGPDPANAPASPGERHLLATIERLARAPEGWSAVALHLSRLAPPGARPHHRRVARALLHDAAQRSGGQVFVLRNADLVLLARDTAPPAATLADRLRALFGPEAADPAAVVSAWRLPHAGAVLLAYVVERLNDPEAAVAEDPLPPSAGVVDAVAHAVAGARPSDVVRRQIAVHVDPSGGSPGMAMRPAYHELTFSLDALEARMQAPPRLAQDLALLLHLGRYLDQRMLQILEIEHGSLSPLDPTATAMPALHLNLSLPGALSDECAALAALCRARGRLLGVEVSLVEAAADPAGFARARARLCEAGARLVLDGVPYLALLLARPGTLHADLLKLEWTPRLAELPAHERAEVARAIAEAGASRVVLQRAEGEAAVRWGLGHRIRLFQGRHIDRMAAVQRMLGCPGAGACTLRHCVDRATATGGGGRAGCTNLPLLDTGLPAPGQA